MLEADDKNDHHEQIVQLDSYRKSHEIQLDEFEFFLDDLDYEIEIAERIRTLEKEMMEADDEETQKKIRTEIQELKKL